MTKPMVSAGYRRTLATKADGTVWAWGATGDGPSGDNSSTERLAPVQLPSLTGVVGVSAGRWHSAVVRSDGTVWAWGNNYYGQLGDGSTTGSATVRIAPAQVQGLDSVIAVSVGTYHTVAVKADGTVWAWGFNGDGRLGDNSRTDRHTPGQVIGLADVVAVSAGADHTVAVKEPLINARCARQMAVVQR